MRLSLLLVALCGACAPPPEGPLSPSDDPDHYAVDTTVSYTVKVSQPRWVVPSAGLPGLVKPLAANNNVDIILYGGRLHMAWRSAESHFASAKARMFLVSSADGGETWQHEQTLALGTDVREPRYLAAGRRLLFHLFEAGSSPLAFDPRHMWRTERLGAGQWSKPVKFGRPKEVPWAMKWRGGRGWMTSYVGNHYNMEGPGTMDVLLRTTADGVTWRPVDSARPSSYHGGVSEAAFEFDAAGGLWAVTRNEDGDSTGFGSHVCFAPKGDLANWGCSKKSDPERYDSPWMFRHGQQIYLVARRDVGGPFDAGLSSLTFAQRKKSYLAAYSTRPKRTALYRVDRATRKVVHLQDLPGAGDTAFPSVRRTGAHSFVLANYTSPLDRPNISWLQGQVSSAGTSIYLLELTFAPKK